MVGVLAKSVVDHRFESRSVQTKDYEIDIWCFSAKHAALEKEKEKRQNQDNMSKWGDMSIRGLLLQ